MSAFSKTGILLVFVTICSGGIMAQSSLHRMNFDAGWKFFLGDDAGAKDPGYNDAGWRTVDLPHDWSIEGAFNEHNSTGQQGGGLPAGIGWYRKKFRVHAADELHFEIEGEGSLAGLDNGYQADLESFRSDHHKAYNGLCLAIVRATKKAGRVLVRVSGKGLSPASLEIVSK